MEKDTTYSTIQFYANQLAAAAVAAYWNNESKDFHKKNAIEAMAKLNELMGKLK